MTAHLYRAEIYSLGGVRGPVSRFPLRGLFKGLSIGAQLRVTRTG